MGRWLRLSESWESCWVEVEVNRCGEWARRVAAADRSRFLRCATELLAVQVSQGVRGAIHSARWGGET